MVKGSILKAHFGPISFVGDIFDIFFTMFNIFIHHVQHLTSTYSTLGFNMCSICCSKRWNQTNRMLKLHKPNVETILIKCWSRASSSPASFFSDELLLRCCGRRAAATGQGIARRWRTSLARAGAASWRRGRLYETECKLLVWGPKRFQIKNLSTIKFHNFSGSTTFILVVSPSEAVYKKLNSFKPGYRWQDDFKLKTCQLQSFIIYCDLQLSYWSFLNPRSFKKWISNFELFQTGFGLTRWFQIKNLSTTKFHNFFWSTTFILVICSYNIVILKRVDGNQRAFSSWSNIQQNVLLH
jgi:hypothetical protein